MDLATIIGVVLAWAALGYSMWHVSHGAIGSYIKPGEMLLVGGCALALKAEWPSCAVYAVEPRGFEDLAASLAAGERRMVAPGGTTLCDGLRAPTTGAITFAILKRELAGARAVDDAQIRAAMALAAEHLKIVVEPSGAAALAAVLAEPRPIGAAIAVVLSGGNVDAELLAQALRAR